LHQKAMAQTPIEAGMPGPALLAMIYDNMSDGVVCFNRDQRVVFCNQAMGLLTGRPLEAILGKQPEEAWGSKGPGQGRRLSSSTTQQVINRPDGTHRVVTVKSFALDGPEGMEIAIYRDVTRIINARRAQERSESLFNAFMEHSPAATSIKDASGRYVFVNKQLSWIMGNKEDLIGRTDFEIWPQDIARRIHDSDMDVMRSNRSRHELEVIPQHGSLHHWLTLRFPLELPGEGPFVCSMSIDITQQREAEEEVRHRLALEGALAGLSAILLSRADDRVGEALGMVGQALEVDRVVLYEARDSGLSLFVLAESWVGPKAVSLKLDSELNLINMPWLGERLSDDSLSVVSNTRSLPEEANYEREWFLRGDIHSFVIVPVSGVDGSHHGFIRFDKLDEPKKWHESDLKLLGMLGEIFSIHMERIEREAELLRANRELQKGLRDRTSEATKKRQYYDELRLMRSVVVNTNDSVIVTEGGSIEEPDPRIIYVNDAFTKMMGYSAEEAMGQSPRFLHGPSTEQASLDRIRRAWERWDSITTEILNYRKNGEPIWVELSIFPVPDETGAYTHWVEIQRDITMRRREQEERARMMERAEQERRMESLEILAGGIAHEFNNLLVGIMGNSSLALEEVGDNSPARENLAQVEKAAVRAADLTRQMLSFSGQDTRSMSALDLSASLQSLMALVERQAIDRQIRLVANFDPQLPPIRGEFSQIREMVMNLLNNAFEAVKPGGEVEVRTELVNAMSAELEDVTPQASLVGGEYVVLSVRDNGLGMEPEVRQRMFEPFFTTKFPGRGLGLSAVLGIIRRHNGAVRVRSTPGEGTSFEFFFNPMTDRQDANDDAISLDPDWRGAGLVLVVDDDEFVRRVASSILERVGFEVISAEDGQQGLELYEQKADQLKAMVLDIKMPRMNGDELLEILRERGSRIPVILSSGYSDVNPGAQRVLDDLSTFLAKPYRPVTLMSALRRLMAKADH